MDTHRRWHCGSEALCQCTVAPALRHLDLILMLQLESHKFKLNFESSKEAPSQAHQLAAEAGAPGPIQVDYVQY